MWSTVILWVARVGLYMLDKAEVERDMKIAYIDFIEKHSGVDLVKIWVDRERLGAVLRDRQRKRDDEPDRPSLSPVAKYEKPNIVFVDIDVRTRGEFKTESGKPRGLVVHYTAGRRDDGSNDALNTLQYMADRGLGCMVMDVDGIIYCPIEQNEFDRVCLHAGRSTWKDVSGLSYYCLGMEICCAGKLSADLKSHWGEQIDPQTVRATDDGVFQTFTKAQEKSLINFCLWQQHINPEFRLDWVMGHNEISAGKHDPGGSLSMTMPELRTRLESMSRVNE